MEIMLTCYISSSVRASRWPPSDRRAVVYVVNAPITKEKTYKDGSSSCVENLQHGNNIIIMDGRHSARQRRPSLARPPLQMSRERRPTIANFYTMLLLSASCTFADRYR